MTKPFYEFTACPDSYRHCDWVGCDKSAIAHGSFFFIDNGFESSSKNIFVCGEHGEYIKNRFEMSTKEQGYLGIQKVDSGKLQFHKNKLEHFEFVVDNYRAVTFNFYLTEYSGIGTRPITVKAYNKFLDRYEIIYGNDKHIADLCLKELFTFTNIDVVRSCKVTLELNPEYDFAFVEYDIWKEPRHG